MKIRYKIFLAFFLTVIIVISCQKEVENIKYPEYKPKLVISGYLVPDKTIHYISIGSNNIFMAMYIKMKKSVMTGTISDGNNEIVLQPFF